jgi:hypothetical protein
MGRKKRSDRSRGSVDQGGATVDATDVRGRTALFHAVAYGAPRFRPIHRQRGASLNLIDARGYTPLDLARHVAGVSSQAAKQKMLDLLERLGAQRKVAKSAFRPSILNPSRPPGDHSRILQEHLNQNRHLRRITRPRRETPRPYSRGKPIYGPRCSRDFVSQKTPFLRLPVLLTRLRERTNTNRTAII